MVSPPPSFESPHPPWVPRRARIASLPISWAPPLPSDRQRGHTHGLRAANRSPGEPWRDYRAADRSPRLAPSRCPRRRSIATFGTLEVSAPSVAARAGHPRGVRAVDRCPAPPRGSGHRRDRSTAHAWSVASRGVRSGVSPPTLSPNSGKPTARMHHGLFERHRSAPKDGERPAAQRRPRTSAMALRRLSRRRAFLPRRLRR